MATASRAVRLKRRVKRELSIAYKMIDILTKQRDQARFIAASLETELKKFTSDPWADYKDPAETTAPVTPELTQAEVSATDMTNEGGSIVG